MKIISKAGEELNFLETGVDGVYVLDRVAFESELDEDGYHDWDKSSGKKKLQEWSERNMPEEILERFDVDLLTAEEVFSQKMLNLYRLGEELKSKQFPIFQDSDNRMMALNITPICWWTRSFYGEMSALAWYIRPDGGIGLTYESDTYGFVPVLRRKENSHQHDITQKKMKLNKEKE